MYDNRTLTRIFLSVLIFTILTQSVVAEKIKVGALICLTGACADTGTNTLRGIQLAIEEIEKKDAIKIELLIEDSNELSGAAPVTAYKALLRKLEQALIIGPSWSIGGMPIAPIASQDKNVLLISPSLGVKEFNETGGNIFNIWPHDDVGTRALASRAFKAGHRKISVIAHLAPWDLAQATTFKEEFIKLGGEVVPYIEYQTVENDLKTYALKVLKSGSSAVYLSNYIQMGLFANELQKYGYPGKKYASYVDKIQIEQAKGNLEGVEFCFQPESSKEFSAAYQKKFGERPNTSADTGYDALKLIYQAIQETQTMDPGVISNYLLTIKNYRGASGEITFDQQGGITREPAFFVLRGENYERVE